MQAERDQRIKQDVTHMQRAFYCQVSPPQKAVYDCYLVIYCGSGYVRCSYLEACV